VLGLHSTQRERDNDVGAAFSACINDPMVKTALNGTPPEPNGRIDAATCTACPPGQFSDNVGACKVCVGTLVGNTCMTCPIDLKLDGATMPLTAPTTDPTVSTPGDTCAGVFWVEIDNPQALYTRGMTRLDLLSGPIDFEGATQADCEHPFELDLGHLASTGPAVDTILTGTGVYSVGGGGGLSVHVCSGYPTKSFLASDVTAGQPLLFAVPATPFTRLIIDARPNGGTKVP
jgi:hypothetical protein